MVTWRAQSTAPAAMGGQDPTTGNPLARDGSILFAFYSLFRYNAAMERSRRARTTSRQRAGFGNVDEPEPGRRR